MLRSPVILGGLVAVLIAIVVITGISIVGGGGDDSNNSAPPRTASPRQTQVSGKLIGRAKVTVNVRSDPGDNFHTLGVLRRGTEVEIVGQSEDGEWFQIVYPANSDLRGWVLAESMEVKGDLSRLTIATPDHIYEPEAPTYQPAATEPPTAPDTPTPETEVPTVPAETPVPSPTVVALPDLVVGGALVSGGAIVVTITNQGAGPLADAVVDVTIYDASGSQVLYSLTTGPHSLPAGASVDVKTDYVLGSGLSQLLIEVDSAGAVEESDDSNNRFSIAISMSAGDSVPRQR